MNKQEIINKTAEFAKRFFEGEAGGHDWFHTERVWKTAKYLAEKEGADLFIVEMAALLHDVADRKLNGGDEIAGRKRVNDWLKQNSVGEESGKVLDVIMNMSFGKEHDGKEIDSIEAFVVQDADRLDAIGAIGIARVFATSAKLGMEIYNPEIKPRTFENSEAYKKYKSTSINHFHEKLLLLKGRLNTETAKKLGEKRHRLMENFLEEFYQEWECKF